MTLLIIISFLLTLNYVFFLLKIRKGLFNLIVEKKNKNLSFPFVSVIVPLRNESDYIESICKSLASLKYEGKYELIFVNDDSEDDTAEKLLKHKPAESLVVNLQPGNSLQGRKKKAVAAGIKKSMGEIIAVTDADCYHSELWLQSMIEKFDDNTGAVAGPVDLITGDSLFGKFQRLEYAGLILAGAGLIGAGEPTICSASNLVYRKKVYEETGGFEDQLRFTSGDDDLFIQKVSGRTNYKIGFSFNKNSLVKTAGKNNFNEFMEQRKRWASKSLFYENKKLVFNIVLLFLFYLSLIIQPLAGIFYHPYFFVTFLISLFCKMIFEYRAVKPGFEYLYDKKILGAFIYSEFIQIPYIISSAVGGLLGGFTWKERKVKR